MEGSSVSNADKKRNKLGYHRTSVACVHCRRRKIRCLVAADDAQGRCENCIRLRKECQFYPVDQQPPVEKKSRPSSRLETTSTDPSTTSSPPPNASGAPEGAENFFSYQPMPLSSSQEVPAFSASGTFPGNPMPSFAPGLIVGNSVGSTDFAPAAPPLDPSVPWDEFTTISDPQMLASMNAGKSQMMNLSPNVWSSPGGTPITPIPSTSPMTATPTVPSQSQPMNAPPTFAMQPDGSVWQVPQPRSMSYPAQQDMATYPNPNQFPPQMHADLKRRMTSPANAFPGTPINAQSPNMQGAPVSMSYPGQPTPMGFPGWQDMSSMGQLDVVPYPMYAGDPAGHATPFASPPMGHPSHGHSPQH
ncbi:hypothetical protein ASPWEDRAFT_104822 [Aspergillus wentii DTO 134E9]|uniref:Zn(2)-C6 fungal-type domain-containing protein n=1 Tax=Aspergillus wentii DTO 134E9 TaxID=1073089 RepID=A0A1L9RT91_ASPWE|nr:uncharacterized protein ASPWEDRAFT_104822 [Aspergillus wentii DTO 134E9]OJJ38135.1 hypothetical protein ASPWEDRAFT_104822 [Aspergillus wentii DTO 134E9]